MLLSSVRPVSWTGEQDLGRGSARAGSGHLDVSAAVAAARRASTGARRSKGAEPDVGSVHSEPIPDPGPEKEGTMAGTYAERSTESTGTASAAACACECRDVSTAHADNGATPAAECAATLSPGERETSSLNGVPDEGNDRAWSADDLEYAVPWPEAEPPACPRACDSAAAAPSTAVGIGPPAMSEAGVLSSLLVGSESNAASAWLGTEPIAASLYDSLVTGGVPSDRVGGDFDVIAGPGALIGDGPRAGDIWIERALGEGPLARLSVVTEVLPGATPTEMAQGEHRGDRVFVIHVTGVAGCRNGPGNLCLRRLPSNGNRLKPGNLLLRPRVPLTARTPGSDARASVPEENTDLDWPQNTEPASATILEATQAEIDKSNIRWLQNALNKILGKKLAVDGDFGRHTRAVLLEYQGQRALDISGIADTPTRHALREDLDRLSAGGRVPPGPFAKPAAALARTPARAISPPPAAPQKFPCGPSVGDRSKCDLISYPEELSGFAQGKHTLVAPRHPEQLIKIARCLLARLAAGEKLDPICVVGHASDEGDEDRNLELGLRRAQEVRRRLIERLNTMCPGTISPDGQSGFVTISNPETRGEADAIIGDRDRSRRVRVFVPPHQLVVDGLRITDNTFSTLIWDQVIGLDTATLNVELKASGPPTACMPAQIPVELSSRLPNLAKGTATLSKPVRIEVPRFGPDAANSNRMVYRVSRTLGSVGEFLKVERSLKEVATIVRHGGTSDTEFRRALGWNSRGVATQPVAVGGSTGSEPAEIPDAFALFRSAGVEVLEVTVPSQANWRTPAAIKRLIRSPADVVYYSGHGLSGSGKLVIDIDDKACGQIGTYRDWLGPADLTRAWVRPMDLDVLILAGCSVLKIDFSTSPASGTGLTWAALLATKGGPLAALLGYQKGAPCDNPNGDRIAKKMAERMAKGSTAFARDWLVVNGDNNANNAVAMDAQGYWWIEGTLTGGFDIKGPKPIP